MPTSPNQPPEVTRPAEQRRGEVAAHLPRALGVGCPILGAHVGETNRPAQPRILCEGEDVRGGKVLVDAAKKGRFCGYEIVAPATPGGRDKPPAGLEKSKALAQPPR